MYDYDYENSHYSAKNSELEHVYDDRNIENDRRGSDY